MGFLDDYEPVEDRLVKFWNDHPKGRVLTKLVNLTPPGTGEIVVIQAEVYRDAEEERPFATGLAHQRIGVPPSGRGGSPESSHPYEICETSAIGRALANGGYAPKGKRPSREEMQQTVETWDVSEWIEVLQDVQKESLKAWWKSSSGPNQFSAKNVPQGWLTPIRAKIDELIVETQSGGKSGNDNQDAEGQASEDDQGVVQPLGG